MKRLVVLLVVLAIVLIAVAAKMRSSPGPDAQARLAQMTDSERVRFEQAKHEFSSARGRLMRMRDEGKPTAELDAQEKKVEEAAQKVAALGGEESLRELGLQGRAGRGAGGRGMGRRGGPGSRRGAARAGRRPGGPTGESAPPGGQAGTDRGK